MGLSKEDKKAIKEFCKTHSIPVKNGFRNFTGNVDDPNALVLSIDDETQVVAFAKFIFKRNSKKDPAHIITYRAIAAGEDSEHKDPRYDHQSYSMTPCMVADVLLSLCGKQFHEIKVVDQEKGLMNVGVSIPIGTLDRRLYIEHQLRLETAPLIPHVSAGGGVATGVHGTGIKRPSLAGLVVMLRFVRPDGVTVTLDERHPFFNTIRPAHLGLFGIVLDMTFQCAKAAKLETTFTSTNIFHLKQKIRAGLLKSENLSIMYIPTYLSNEDAEDCPPNVMLINWKPVPLSTPERGQCDEIENFSQKISIKLQEDFQVMDLLKKHPALVPPFMRYFVSEMQVKGEDRTVVSHAYEGAHFKNQFPRDLADASWIFPVSKKGHGKEVIDALTLAVDNLKAGAKSGKYACSYAIFLRFFQGTNGGLSTSCHREDQFVCGFDVTSAKNMPGFDEFVTDMNLQLTTQFHGKPHHGKTVLPGTSYKKLYGESYDDFMVALSAWLAACNLEITTNPHLNDFFASLLGIEKLLSLHATQNIKSSVGIKNEDLPQLAETALNELKNADANFKKNPAGKVLKAHLKAIAATGDKTAVSSNTSASFQSVKSLEKIPEGELVVVPKEKKAKGCGCF